MIDVNKYTCRCSLTYKKENKKGLGVGTRTFLHESDYRTRKSESWAVPLTAF